MKRGSIAQVDNRGNVFIREQTTDALIPARYFSGATEGAQVVFETTLDEDNQPYAKNIFIVANQLELLVLEKLQDLQTKVNKILDFELPEDYFKTGS